jgi:hypothetical protein
MVFNALGVHCSSAASEPRRAVQRSVSMKPQFTPDGRYLIVRGRLWRAANPVLAPPVRSELVQALMTARREVKTAIADADEGRLARARSAVHVAKVQLGERGPVWWTDGAKDFTRHFVENSPYAQWYRGLTSVAARDKRAAEG